MNCCRQKKSPVTPTIRTLTERWAAGVELSGRDVVDPRKAAEKAAKGYNKPRSKDAEHDQYDDERRDQAVALGQRDQLTPPAAPRDTATAAGACDASTARASRDTAAQSRAHRLDGPARPYRDLPQLSVRVRARPVRAPS